MSTCPPCNQKCNQGRDCPANKQGHAEAMKRALTALEIIERFLDPLAKWQVRKPKDGGPMITVYPQKVAEEAINALRAALSEHEPQPVAWYDSLSGWTDFGSYRPHRKPSSPSAEWIPLYASPIKKELTCVCGAVWDGEQMVHAPRKREWVGLTDEDYEELLRTREWGVYLIEAVENKLKEKNT